MSNPNYPTQSQNDAKYALKTRTGNQPVGQGEIVINVRDTAYGALGDGVTDDGPALRSALTAATTVGARVIRIPTGTYYYKASSSLTPPAGVTVRGDGPGQTILLVDAATSGAYTEAFNFANDNVALENLTVRRASDYPAVLFPVGAVANPSMTNVAVDGQRGTYSTNYCHGFQVGRSNTGSTTNLLVQRSSFTGLSYGLFQTNTSTATLDGLSFLDCTFTANSSTDLEFNSPMGITTRVRVERCAFSNNTATGAGAGFAVGLAHIVDVVVRGCSITGTYNNEAIHIEDYSTDVTIESNRLTTGGILQGSMIQVISGAQRVRIARNTFDGSSYLSSASVYMINVLAGGTGTTPGGRAQIAPTFISIDDNDIFTSNTNLKPIYFEAVLYGQITKNRIAGSGTVTSGSFGGNFQYAMNIYSSPYTTITENKIKGFTYGLYVRNDTIGSFGNGSIISNNSFRDCLLALPIVNIGSSVIDGNSIYNCTYSVILGYGNYPNDSVVISNNNAQGCANPMGIYGSIAIKATGTATTGTSKTLTVSALPNVLPSGSVITFSGGGVFTTSAIASFQAGSITGTLATNNIAANETALVYVPYSTTATRNRTLANNSDDYYGASGYGRRSASASSSYAVIGYEELIYATSSGITVTLPPASRYSNQSFSIKNTSTGNITVASAGGMIDGSSTFTLGTLIGNRYTSDGTNWNMI